MINHLQAVAAHAYYTGHMAAGRDACERILRMPVLPDSVEVLTRANRTWYTQPLSELVATTLYRQIDGERIGIRPGWSAFNPSILATTYRGSASVMLCAIRSSNYSIREGHYTIPPEDGGVIKTVNYLAILADDLELLDAREIAIDYEHNGFEVTGLEDIRLNQVGERILGSATARDLGPRDGTCRIATFEIEELCRAVRIACPETPGGRHEKNWMPIVGRERFVYSCHHEGLVSVVERDGVGWRVDAGPASPPVARHFRGGSQAVPIDERRGSGRLAVIHEVSDGDAPRRVYEHRFVRFTDEGQIVGVSPPFVFRETRQIEFCSGLAIRGDRVIASFGVRDAEAWLVELRLPEVVRLLEKPA
jgi:hypothetical protein